MSETGFAGAGVGVATSDLLFAGRGGGACRGAAGVTTFAVGASTGATTATGGVVALGTLPAAADAGGSAVAPVGTVSGAAVTTGVTTGAITGGAAAGPAGSLLPWRSFVATPAPTPSTTSAASAT